MEVSFCINALNVIKFSKKTNVAFYTRLGYNSAPLMLKFGKNCIDMP